VQIKNISQNFGKPNNKIFLNLLSLENPESLVQFRLPNTLKMRGLLRRTIQHVILIKKDLYVIEKDLYVKIRRLRLILYYRFFSCSTVVFIGRMDSIRVLSEM
jgi:hypothetical protein